MRVSICFRHHGIVRRLAVVTESRDGVYACHMTMNGFECHSSYHTDGTRHLKANGKVVGDKVSGQPISSLQGVAQIIHSTVSLAHPSLEDQPAYKGDQGTETVVMLHDHLLESEQQRFALDVWLFDAASEAAFYESVCGIETTGLARILDMTFSLARFPGHMVGISLRAQDPWSGGSAPSDISAFSLPRA